MFGLIVFLILLVIAYVVYVWKTTPTWRRIINMMTITDPATKLAQTWWIARDVQPFYIQLQNFTGKEAGEVKLAEYNSDGSYKQGGVVPWAGLPDGSLRVGQAKITLASGELTYGDNYIASTWAAKLTAAPMPVKPVSI